jgi:hypothetical protein
MKHFFGVTSSAYNTPVSSRLIITTFSSISLT